MTESMAAIQSYKEIQKLRKSSERLEAQGKLLGLKMDKLQDGLRKYFHDLANMRQCIELMVVGDPRKPDEAPPSGQVKQ
jgi:ribosomal protein S2